MEKDEFKELLLQKTKNLDALLEKFLPVEEGLQKTVEEAMNYSVRAGGKRLRPMLMGETFFLCGGKDEDVRLLEPFMAALEMIHTYSLVHDDLPAMDNDMYRRGKKTTWAVYGDAFGVLAGDGLLNYAFETAAGALKACEERENLVDFKKVSKALAILGKKAGIYGMIGGQTADIEAEDQKEAVTGEQLMFIHEHKTAALIEAAMMIGAVLAGAEKEKVEALEKCASNVACRWTRPCAPRSPKAGTRSNAAPSAGLRLRPTPTGPNTARIVRCRYAGRKRRNASGKDTSCLRI